MRKRALEGRNKRMPCGGSALNRRTLLGRRNLGRMTMNKLTRRAFGVAGFAADARHVGELCPAAAAGPHPRRYRQGRRRCLRHQDARRRSGEGEARRSAAGRGDGQGVARGHQGRFAKSRTAHTPPRHVCDVRSPYLRPSRPGSDFAMAFMIDLAFTSAAILDEQDLDDLRRRGIVDLQYALQFVEERLLAGSDASVGQREGQLRALNAVARRSLDRPRAARRHARVGRIPSGEQSPDCQGLRRSVAGLTQEYGMCRAHHRSGRPRRRPPRHRPRWPQRAVPRSPRELSPAAGRSIWAATFTRCHDVPRVSRLVILRS